jgi:hypothetical protein
MTEQWAQVITIIGVLGGLMYYLIQRVDKDINAIGERMDRSESRMDKHAQRIDQLYTMFIDLIKEGKK